MIKCIVIIDAQNDFITGPLGTNEAVTAVDNITNLISKEDEYTHIIMTRDSHDYFYLNSPEGQKLPVEHCIIDTPGWCIESKLDRAIATSEFRSLNIINKETFGDIGLPLAISEDYAKDGWILDSEDFIITIVGLCTDICVISNALILKAAFPNTKIVVDASCCAGTTKENHYKALDIMKQCQIDIVNDNRETK